MKHWKKKTEPTLGKQPKAIKHDCAVTRREQIREAVADSIAPFPCRCLDIEVNYSGIDLWVDQLVVVRMHRDNKRVEPKQSNEFTGNWRPHTAVTVVLAGIP
jgi:hypothetical protein